MLVILGELELSTTNKRYKSRAFLRRPNTLLLEYRILESIHAHVNAWLGPAFLPMNALMGQFVIFCNVTLIQNWKELDFSSKFVLSETTVVLTVFWTFVLEMCGQQYSKCRKVLDSWRFLKFAKSSEAKYFFKIRKTCPVMSFGVAGTFTIKRKTVLSFVKGVSRGTFRALMTLK
jgi:hypothetical protein